MIMYYNTSFIIFLQNAMPVIILSLILSITLALLFWGASILFYVEEDPRLRDLIDLLPNQNCGMCGNPGCKGMAEAILQEDARLTQCKPSTKEMRQEIAQYLKTHPDEAGDYVKVKM